MDKPLPECISGIISPLCYIPVIYRIYGCVHEDYSWVSLFIIQAIPQTSAEQQNQSQKLQVLEETNAALQQDLERLLRATQDTQNLVGFKGVLGDLFIKKRGAWYFVGLVKRRREIVIFDFLWLGK